MQEKLFDSEAKVMDILWEKAPISAKEVSRIAAETIGWNKNTTYTVLKKLVAKGFIRREDPGFICTPLVSRDRVQKQEVATLIQKVFGAQGAVLRAARRRAFVPRGDRGPARTHRPGLRLCCTRRFTGCST